MSLLNKLFPSKEEKHTPITPVVDSFELEVTRYGEVEVWFCKHVATGIKCVCSSSKSAQSSCELQVAIYRDLLRAAFISK